ncbi:hypothetical protein AHAS_AhasUnG0028800 [Arachis hypogaea]
MIQPQIVSAITAKWIQSQIVSSITAKWILNLNQTKFLKRLGVDQNFLGSLSVVDEQLVPKVGMTFKSLEDAVKFYKDYAKATGLLYPVKPLSCCISGASKFQPISRT